MAVIMIIGALMLVLAALVVAVRLSDRGTGYWPMLVAALVGGPALGWPSATARCSCWVPRAPMSRRGAAQQAG